MECKSTTPSIPAYLHPGGRLIAKGSAALSNAELLAVILRIGSTHETALHLADRLLDRFNGLSGLAQASVTDLQSVHGISISAVSEIVAVFELSRRLMRVSSSDRPQIITAEDAARYLADMGALLQEHVRVILLDTNRRVVAAPTIYIGTVNLSVLRIAEIFREAITHNCPFIVMAHNHPSGDPTPSPEDVELTRAVAIAGRLLDITLVDHVIVGQPDWVSLREQGFLA